MTERGKRYSIQEWLAQPEERRLELINGSLVEKAAPDAPHALSQAAIVGNLHPVFHRRGGGGAGAPPGGWWLMTEPDIQLGDDGYRPDIAGWRRERAASPPQGRPLMLAPDWVCEVISETNRTNDTIRKLRRYHEARVGHYWLLDPADGTLTVMRWEATGYLTILTADRKQRVRAEPFDAIELRVAALFGDDD